MQITSIQLIHPTSTDEYDSYKLLMLDLMIYYFPFLTPDDENNLTTKSSDIAMLAIEHFCNGFSLEQQIATTYDMPSTSLVGAQLIFGSSTRARALLLNPELRRKIISNAITYQIAICTSSRRVTVWKTEDDEQSIDHTYILTHQFYKYATEPNDLSSFKYDPIAPVA